MQSAKGRFITACSTLRRGEAGSTGEWRFERPVLDPGKCIPCKKQRHSCYLCWLYCPEGTVKRGIPVEIDLEFCKGCGVCAAVCPVKAICMEPEEKFLEIERGDQEEED